MFRAQPELKLGRNDPLPQNKPGSECPTGQLGVTASIAPEARLTVQKTHEWPSLSLFLATAASRNCLLKAYRRGVQPITSELDDEYIYTIMNTYLLRVDTYTDAKAIYIMRRASCALPEHVGFAQASADYPAGFRTAVLDSCRHHLPSIDQRPATARTQPNAMRQRAMQEEGGAVTER